MSNMQENLKAYIDGELTPQDAQMVEQALQRDAALRKEFDEMRRISSTLREASSTPTVSGLDKTLAELDRRESSKRLPLLRFAPAAGVVFACALAVVMIGRFNGAETAFNDESPMPASKTNIASNHAPAGAMGGMKAGRKSTFSTSPVARPNMDGFVQSDGIDLKQEKAPSQKQIVKTGEIRLTVPSAKQAVDTTTALATRLGGLVESSTLNGDEKTGMEGTLTIRVPVAHFDETMAGIQKLGKVTGISSSGQDVTSEVVSNAARLRTMKGQEEAYQKILTGAKHVNDVLAVKDRLDTVQQEIATLEAGQKTLKSQAAMSTINLTITQPAKVAAAGTVKDDWLDKTWSRAWVGLSGAGRQIAEAIIYLVVFCPVWIPLVVLANLLGRRIRQTA